MANLNAPFGLKPVRHFNGSKWNGQATLYYIPSTDNVAYYIGDVVASSANGDVVNGCSAVALFGSRGSTSTSGNTRGVIVGFGAAGGNVGASVPLGADPDSLGIMYIPATKSKNYYVWVADDPTLIFEAQTNTIANTAFNKNTGFVVANAPTAPVVQSASYVDGASATTTSTLPIKIIGAPNRPDNDLTSPGTNAKIYVILNTHELFGATAGV